MKLLKIDRVQKNILIIYLVTCIIGFSYYIYMHISGHQLYCPFYEATGLYCPGCGITRSCVQFIHLNFYHSFLDHPAFFINLIVWMIISIVAFFRKSSVFRSSKTNLKILYICMALYIIFSIIRNIPGFEFLHPIDV